LELQVELELEIRAPARKFKTREDKRSGRRK
jgi:hypothetical protein